MTILIIGVLITFLLSTILSYFTMKFIQTSNKTRGNDLLEAPSNSKNITFFYMAVKNKLYSHIKKIFGAKMDIDLETVYFSIHFLLHMQTGGSVYGSLKQTYFSLQKADFSIANIIKEVLFRMESGMPLEKAIVVLKKYKDARLLNEIFISVAQANQLGIAIEDSIRTSIDEFQLVRVLEAEEKASKASVLIAVPIVFGFLPSIILLVIYPVIINILNTIG